MQVSSLGPRYESHDEDDHDSDERGFPRAQSRPVLMIPVIRWAK